MHITLLHITFLFFSLLTMFFVSSLQATTGVQYSPDYLFDEEQFIFPSDQFKNEANIQSWALFNEARDDREAFWGKQAQCLHWFVNGIKFWTGILPMPNGL